MYEFKQCPRCSGSSALITIITPSEEQYRDEEQREIAAYEGEAFFECFRCHNRFGYKMMKSKYLLSPGEELMLSNDMADWIRKDRLYTLQHELLKAAIEKMDVADNEGGD